TDHGGADTGSSTATVNVVSVNDAPVNSAPASLTATEDTDFAVTGLSISDVDDNGNSSYSTTLGVTHGTLSVNTVTGGASVAINRPTVTLSGTLAQINTTLAANAVIYHPNVNFNGADSLGITTSDGGASGIGGAKSDVDTVTLNVTAVNDAPVASGSATLAA